MTGELLHISLVGLLAWQWFREQGADIKILVACATVAGISLILLVVRIAYLRFGDQWSAWSPSTKGGIEILWKCGETDYCLYYGERQALHYWICVFNHSKTRKATNVQVLLEKLDPPELKCVPCTLRLKNDIRKDGDHTPYKQNFELKAGQEQFIDLLIQDPTEKDFWIVHAVNGYSELVRKQPYKLTISATTDNPSIKDRRKYELFKNGPYWQMREIALT